MRATYAGLHVEKRNEEALIAGGELQERHRRPRAASTKLRLPFHVQTQGGTTLRRTLKRQRPSKFTKESHHVEDF